MTRPVIPWPRALDMAQAGFDAWAAKPHNRKWVRRIDGTPIKNDLLVNIADAIVAAMPETAMEERQARILRMEKRIHNQRKALQDTWETIEMRASHRRAWYRSPLLRAMLRRGTRRPQNWWQRLLGVAPQSS